MNKAKIVTPLAALALVATTVGGFVSAAHADTTTPTTQSSTTGQGTRPKPAAVGTVTSVSGDTITLTDKQSGTTYTIDATNATIEEMPKMNQDSSSTDTSSGSSSTTRPTLTTITVSDIAVGDTLMVQGTTSGTSITATKITDGQFGKGGFGGHGHPGVNGTVTGVNGTTITIQDANGTTYTVDASSATATKMETISVSDIAVGDKVGIDGTVSGSSVTAKNIMDGAPQGGPGQ